MPAPKNDVAPKIERLTLTHLPDGDPRDLTEDVSLEGARYAAAEGELDLDDGSLADSKLVRCSVGPFGATRMSWKGLELKEVELERPNVAVLTAPRTDWRSVRITGGRLGAVEAYSATWTSVVLTGMRIRYLNLRDSTLKHVVLADCVIDELDLAGASVSRMSLAGCRVDRLHLHGASLADLDLRGAQLHEIVGMRFLGGSIIDEVQLSQLAPTFATALGITVLSDDDGR